MRPVILAVLLVLQHRRVALQLLEHLFYLLHFDREHRLELQVTLVVEQRDQQLQIQQEPKLVRVERLLLQHVDYLVVCWLFQRLRYVVERLVELNVALQQRAVLLELFEVEFDILDVQLFVQQLEMATELKVLRK